MDFVREAVLQNLHWESGVLSFPRLSGPLVEREVFLDARRSVGRKFITLLRGMRRTGKSVLARQLAADRLRAASSPREVAWFEFDRAMNASPDDVDALLRFFLEGGAATVVLDEVAFVPRWQDVLKRHYDRTDAKFIVTGSSAIDLDRRTSESLAGRFQTIHVQPFSLAEALRLEGRGPPETRAGKAQASERMQLECGRYLERGGLPEIAGVADANLRVQYVKESLLDPLFYKDFPAVFPNANPDLMRKTLELLSGTVGSTYQLQPFAEALGCSLPTAATQVEMLEKTLLTRTSYNLTPSLAKQRRTAKKIVFADSGILHAVNPQAVEGQLAENAVLNALGAAFFWRDGEGHEVDAVFPGDKTVVEVKYSEKIVSADERNLRLLLEKKRGWRGVMVTKNEYEKGDILRIPLWQALLEPRRLLEGGKKSTFS